MMQTTETSAHSLLASDEGFDPNEDRLRANIRSTIEAVFHDELDGFLGRLRYGRTAVPVKGYRQGHRDRQVTGTFGTETISVPRARVEDEAGKVTEWRSKGTTALPAPDEEVRSADCDGRGVGKFTAVRRGGTPCSSMRTLAHIGQP